VHSREELFQKVWETTYTEDTRTLDVHISWLRHALEEDPPPTCNHSDRTLHRVQAARTGD